MQPIDSSLSRLLTDPIAANFASWLDALREALEPEFVSLILYGGLARGSFHPGSSDINLMAVVKSAPATLLEKLTPVVNQGARDLKTRLLLITERELAASTDVFPVKFLDIQRNHRVLAGKPVLDGLTIDRAHLRRRCEQELRNLVLNLRRHYIRGFPAPEAMSRLIHRAVPAAIANLRTLVELKTDTAPGDPEALFEAATKAGCEVGPLAQALAVKNGELKPSPAELKAILLNHLGCIERMTELADQLETTS